MTLARLLSQTHDLEYVWGSKANADNDSPVLHWTHIYGLGSSQPASLLLMQYFRYLLPCVASTGQPE